MPKDRTASSTPSVSDTEDDTTKEVKFPSPDGKFALLIGHGEDQQNIDLIEKKTEKVLQRIADDEMPLSKLQRSLGTGFETIRAHDESGHPNQGVSVYLLKGDKFQETNIPDLSVEIPAKIRAGKDHPHVASNNWHEAEKWNKDGSLLLTIDNTIDGAGHTASATRTVLLGFDKSGKAKILKSTVKYESRSDDED